MRIAVIHGPNLRLLGTREPEVYGTETLSGLNDRIQAEAHSLSVEVEIHQSNHEGELVDLVEALRDRVSGLVVNAGAYTHTSVALRDALVGIGLPFVEVHLSNTAAREPFRHHSYLSEVALGVVYGFGAESYLLGLRGLAMRLQAADR